MYERNVVLRMERIDEAGRDRQKGRRRGHGRGEYIRGDVTAAGVCNGHSPAATNNGSGNKYEENERTASHDNNPAWAALLLCSIFEQGGPARQ